MDMSFFFLACLFTTMLWELPLSCFLISLSTAMSISNHAYSLAVCCPFVHQGVDIPGFKLNFLAWTTDRMSPGCGFQLGEMRQNMFRTPFVTPSMYRVSRVDLQEACSVMTAANELHACFSSNYKMTIVESLPPCRSMNRGW